MHVVFAAKPKELAVDPDIDAQVTSDSCEAVPTASHSLPAQSQSASPGTGNVTSVCASQSSDAPLLSSEPNQPRSFDFPVIVISGKNRSFKAEWFDKWTWLDWDEQGCNVKCYTCRMAVSLNFLTFSKNADRAFTDFGFKN